MTTETIVETTLQPFNVNGTETIEFYVDKVAAYFHKLSNASIFTTVGVTRSSVDIASCKPNGVARTALKAHIWYNLTYRPARALYVNGELVYAGIDVNPTEALIDKIRALKITADTKPYQ